MGVYQSIGQANDFGDAGGVGNQITVPKPSGVEVGDLLIAGIYGNESSLSNITAPAGWTEQDQNQQSTDWRLEAFYKVATSDDVAASQYNFTLTDGSSSDNYAGYIVRVSDWGFVDTSVDGGASVGGTGSFTMSGFTPTRANELLIAFIGQGLKSTESNLTTGPLSFATNNPTWTQRGTEIEIDVTNNTQSFVCYTATRAETTATGTITVSVTSVPGVNRALCIVVAIAPQVDGSVTPTTKLNAYALTPIQSAKLNAVADAPTTDSRFDPTWINTDKPTEAGWTNTDK